MKIFFVRHGKDDEILEYTETGRVLSGRRKSDAVLFADKKLV